MRRTLKILPYAVLMLIFMVVALRGTDLRNTWEDDTNLRNKLQNERLEVLSSDLEEEISFLMPEKIRDFNGLCEKADVIAHVKLDKKMRRKNYMQCTLTEVQVLKVYQGCISSDTISVFEPAYIENDTLFTVGNYQMMEDGKEYILFLKEIDCSLYDGKKRVYIVTTTGLSKYQCEGKKLCGNMGIIPKEKEVSYKKVCSFDAISSNEKRKNMYDYYKRQIQILVGGEEK